MSIKPSFLGRGAAFPLRLDANGIRPEFVEDEELVKDSIQAIILTDIGERPFRVKRGVLYGTRVSRLLFESSESVLDQALFDIRSALATWEPRITLLDVTVERAYDSLSKSHGARINVLFSYRATNRTDNLVVTVSEEVTL